MAFRGRQGSPALSSNPSQSPQSSRGGRSAAASPVAIVLTPPTAAFSTTSVTLNDGDGGSASSPALPPAMPASPQDSARQRKGLSRKRQKVKKKKKRDPLKLLANPDAFSLDAARTRQASEGSRPSVDSDYDSDFRPSESTDGRPSLPQEDVHEAKDLPAAVAPAAEAPTGAEMEAVELASPASAAAMEEVASPAAARASPAVVKDVPPAAAEADDAAPAMVRGGEAPTAEGPTFDLPAAKEPAAKEPAAEGDAPVTKAEAAPAAPAPGEGDAPAAQDAHGGTRHGAAEDEASAMELAADKVAAEAASPVLATAALDAEAPAPKPDEAKQLKAVPSWLAPSPGPDGPSGRHISDASIDFDPAWLGKPASEDAAPTGFAGVLRDAPSKPTAAANPEADAMRSLIDVLDNEDLNTMDLSAIGSPKGRAARQDSVDSVGSAGGNRARRRLLNPAAGGTGGVNPLPEDVPSSDSDQLRANEAAADGTFSMDMASPRYHSSFAEDAPPESMQDVQGANSVAAMKKKKRILQPAGAAAGAGEGTDERAAADEDEVTLAMESAALPGGGAAAPASERMRAESIRSRAESAARLRGESGAHPAELLKGWGAAGPAVDGRQPMKRTSTADWIASMIGASGGSIAAAGFGRSVDEMSTGTSIAGTPAASGRGRMLSFASTDTDESGDGQRNPVVSPGTIRALEESLYEVNARDVTNGSDGEWFRDTLSLAPPGAPLGRAERLDDMRQRSGTLASHSRDVRGHRSTSSSSSFADLFRMRSDTGNASSVNWDTQSAQSAQSELPPRRNARQTQRFDQGAVKKSLDEWGEKPSEPAAINRYSDPARNPFADQKVADVRQPQPSEAETVEIEEMPDLDLKSEFHLRRARNAPPAYLSGPSSLSHSFRASKAILFRRRESFVDDAIDQLRRQQSVTLIPSEELRQFAEVYEATAEMKISDDDPERPSEASFYSEDASELESAMSESVADTASDIDPRDGTPSLARSRVPSQAPSLAHSTSSRMSRRVYDRDAGSFDDDSEYSSVGDRSESVARWLDNIDVASSVDSSSSQFVSVRHLDREKEILRSSTQRQLRVAVRRFQQDIEQVGRTYGHDNPGVADRLHELGVLYMASNKWRRAKHCFEQALVFRKQHFEDDHPRVGDTYYNLAVLFRARDKWTHAAAYFAQAGEVYMTCYGDGHEETRDALQSMTRCRDAAIGRKKTRSTLWQRMSGQTVPEEDEDLEEEDSDVE